MSLGIALLTIGVAFLSSLVTSAVLILFGGYGGMILLRKSLLQAQDDILRIDDKLTREVKTRAGLKSAEKGQEKNFKAEAEKILQQAGQNQTPTVDARGADRTAILKQAGLY